LKLGFVRVFDGLAARVAGTLALALLPIGAIAVFQAFVISREGERGTVNAILNATAEAAAGEALAVASASGTSGTLAAHMSGLGGAHEGCSQIFTSVVEIKRQYSFAGFIDSKGIVRCGSSNVGFDLSQGAIYPKMSLEQKQIVSANLDGPISGTSVILVATPVFDDQSYIGYVSVSVPHRRISEVLHSVGPYEQDTAIVTFNSDGKPLSSSAGFDDINTILPADLELGTIATERQHTFVSKSHMGETRIFAAVPIIPGVLYALGSQPRPAVAWTPVWTVVFPALMLIAGLLVAFQAVHRLVIRHIRGLIRNMAEFSKTWRISPLPGRTLLSQEIREIDVAWTDLAAHLLRDEAELQNMVHEKNVLLKEVHHRVKNNLQLIASIVSLKIRRATSEEARRSLREVQMRVRSIASVHQALYSSPEGGRVRADELLGNVIGGIIEAGVVKDRRVEVRRSYDPVQLYPDQAIPFLLMASEAVTNALKYMGRLEDGSAWLEISLEAVSDDEAKLHVWNTCGTPFLPPDQVKGSGLGRSLIAGFAAQVEGKVTVEETEDSYRFQLAFTPASFDPEERDVSVSDIEAPSSDTEG
jgi:two-component sensor histidine kinase